MNRPKNVILGLSLAASAAALHAQSLQLQVLNADAGSFHANAVLVTGTQDALLLDTGFSRADALRIAAAVLDSKKTLRTIYISQADPDYYFGAAELQRLFPQARLVSTAATRQKIEATLATKLSVWGPRLGANAPAGAVPLPEVLAQPRLELEGQALEIRGGDDALPHRSYVWIPSLRTIAGGVNVFAGVHPWTADTPTPAKRAAWVAKLDAMAALEPARVIPGHSLPGQAQDLGQIRWTQAYLRRFEQALPAAADAQALIATMREAYPQAGLGISLEIGAKVAKGEMTW